MNLCYLHPSSPMRGYAEAAGITEVCQKTPFASDDDLAQHMQRRHKADFLAIQRRMRQDMREGRPVLQAWLQELERREQERLAAARREQEEKYRQQLENAWGALQASRERRRRWVQREAQREAEEADAARVLAAHRRAEAARQRAEDARWERLYDAVPEAAGWEREDVAYVLGLLNGERERQGIPYAVMPLIGILESALRGEKVVSLLTETYPGLTLETLCDTAEKEKGDASSEEREAA